MQTKKKGTRGLRLRGGVWHIQKVIYGQRIHESTGSGDLIEAERYLARRTEQIRKYAIYGERPDHSLDEAAARYLMDNRDQRGIARTAYALTRLVEWFGETPISKINGETLRPYLDARAAGRDGRRVSPGTLIREMAALKAVLRQAATSWRNGNGTTWLERTPDFPAITNSPRKPRPINWEEQARLFQALPGYLARMALFAVNTGCRDQEVCGLKWDWEYELNGRSAFVIPESATKNGESKIVPLNSIAQSIIDGARGESNEWVFTLNGSRVSRMTNRAWRLAREQAGLREVRVHDLRHSFAVRLRAANVAQEDIQDLLGHKQKTVTQHYATATVERLFGCVDRLTDVSARPAVLLRRVERAA